MALRSVDTRGGEQFALGMHNVGEHSLGTTSEPAEQEVNGLAAPPHQQQEQSKLQAAGQSGQVEVSGDENVGGVRASENSKSGRSWSMTATGLLFSHDSERMNVSGKKSITAAASNDAQRHEQQRSEAAASQPAHQGASAAP